MNTLKLPNMIAMICMLHIGFKMSTISCEFLLQTSKLISKLNFQIFSSVTKHGPLEFSFVGISFAKQFM